MAGLIKLIEEQITAITASDFTRNPWSPETAPMLLSVGKLAMRQLVKMSFTPAMTSTVARRIEIIRIGKRRLPK